MKRGNECCTVAGSWGFFPSVTTLAARNRGGEAEGVARDQSAGSTLRSGRLEVDGAGIEVGREEQASAHSRNELKTGGCIEGPSLPFKRPLKRPDKFSLGLQS